MESYGLNWGYLYNKTSKASISEALLGNCKSRQFQLGSRQKTNPLGGLDADNYFVIISKIQHGCNFLKLKIIVSSCWSILLIMLYNAHGLRNSILSVT